MDQSTQSEENGTYSINDEIIKIQTKVNNIDDLLNKIVVKLGIVTTEPTATEVEPEKQKGCNYKYCIGCMYTDYDECEYKDMKNDMTKKCTQCNNSYHMGYDYKKCVQCGNIYCDNCKSYYFLCAETCVIDL